MRKNISSGTQWEDLVGYSRAVRVGNRVEVSGTVATEDGEVIGKGDPYKQTKYILNKISDVLKEADVSMEDVTRTRIYVTNISKWREIGKAHGEAFGEIRPATTMVEVKSLIHADYLVEIEVTAIQE